jgi:glutamine synthetase
MTFRHIIKEVALDQGCHASFMPKPFTEHPGSGMHTHFSLFQGEKNAFIYCRHRETCTRIYCSNKSMGQFI